MAAGVRHQLTLTTAQGIFALAALAVASGLWAAQVTVNSTINGPDWALQRLPGVFRLSLVAAALGVISALVISPGWIGLGVAYLAGVVAWTARSVARGIRRVQEVGALEPLPPQRQAALVGKTGLWLLIVGAVGVAVAVIDLEQRGSVALWDFVLVAVVVAVGMTYRKRAGRL